jgi:ribose 5-phosphate isomerase B
MYRISIASDHGGYRLKNVLVKYLREELAYEIVDDLGPFDSGSVNYPEYALLVARSIAMGHYDIGIMLDGVGIGSTMLANKVDGVRCAMCYDDFTTNNAREHNHANMLCIGGQTIGDTLAKAIVKKFLNTIPAPGRHADRVQMIMDVELMS